jgi:hypothetical protein
MQYNNMAFWFWQVHVSSESTEMNIVTTVQYFNWLNIQDCQTVIYEVDKELKDPCFLWKINPEVQVRNR